MPLLPNQRVHTRTYSKLTHAHISLSELEGNFSQTHIIPLQNRNHIRSSITFWLCSVFNHNSAVIETNERAHSTIKAITNNHKHANSKQRNMPIAYNAIFAIHIQSIYSSRTWWKILFDVCVVRPVVLMLSVLVCMDWTLLNSEYWSAHHRSGRCSCRNYFSFFASVRIMFIDGNRYPGKDNQKQNKLPKMEKLSSLLYSLSDL